MCRSAGRAAPLDHLPDRWRCLRRLLLFAARALINDDACSWDTGTDSHNWHVAGRACFMRTIAIKGSRVVAAMAKESIAIFGASARQKPAIPLTTGHLERSPFSSPIIVNVVDCK